MPLGKIDLRPGVNIELTPTKNEGGFSTSQLIRFFSGQLQKLGGWAKLAGLGKLVGVCRGLLAWADLVGTPYLAAGTEQRLYVVSGGVLSDITPLAATRNIAPAFSTVAGSSIVTVTDSGYTTNPGDWINLPTQVSRGGIILFGYYQVQVVIGTSVYTIDAGTPALLTQVSGGSVPTYNTTNGSSSVRVVLVAHGLILGANFQALVSTTVATVIIFGNYSVAQVIDANTFIINASSNANATTTGAENGGNARIQYLIPSGVGVNTALGGWGTGDWGAGDWGLSDAGTTSTLIRKARTWSLDHFGQDLIASPDMGAIYHWSPPTIAPAVVVDASAPTMNRVVLSVAQVQIIVACGSSVGSDHFPTLIRWCDSGDFTDWVATTTNQAGSFQLPTGSYVTAALAIGLELLIWTDANLWTMVYQGLPFVFGFNQIGVACEALSKKAPAVFGGSVVWPSTHGFFRYDGSGVQPLVCPVWDFIYNSLDLSQADQVCSGVNTLFSEVSWFFPKATGGIGYVKLNYSSSAGAWDYGDQLQRTAWFDHSVFGNPVGADENGYLQQHEVSADADGVPMVSYAQTGFYDLQDGTELNYVNVVMPDFIASAGSSLQLTILATDYPGEPVRSYGPYVITPITKRINTSLRGRQVAFRIGSSDPGSFWRMGAVRYSSAPAGRR